jgi:hypothetical protein
VTLRNSQTALVAALAALALLIAGAGVFTLVLPQRSKANELKSQLASAESALVAARVSSTSAAAVDATDLFRLTEAMPDRDQMPGILIGLSRIATESSVTLTAVRPAPRIQLTGYSALPIVIVAQGRYAGVTAFLRKLRMEVQTSHNRLSVTGRLFVANQIQLVTTDGRTVSATINLDAFEYVAAPPVSATAGVNAATGGSTASTQSTSTTTSTTATAH